MKTAAQILFNREETESIIGISSVLGLRMLGLSMTMTIFTLFAHSLDGTSHFLAGLALGAYGLTQILVMVPSGRISDRFGRRPVVVICISIFCLASALAALSHHIITLIISRLLLGTGAISPAAYAWIADAIRTDRRNRAMAYIGMGIGISVALGLILGPVIGGSFGLRSLFWICAFSSLLSVLYLLIFMRDPPRRKHHREIEIDTGQFKAVWGNWDLRLLYATGFLNYFTLSAIFYVIPLLLQQYLKPAGFWIIFLPTSILGVVTMIIGSRLADRGKTRSVLFLGFSFTICAGFSLLSSTSLLVVFVAILAFYLGFSILEPILATAVTKIARADLRGTTVGVYNMSQSTGTFFGGAIAGGLYHFHPDFIFATLALAGFLGILATYFLQLKSKHGF